MKNRKRILSVTIRHLMDDCPDTSYLGEYSNRPAGDNSIVVGHDKDCPCFWYGGPDTGTLDRAENYLCHSYDDRGGSRGDESPESNALDAAQDILIEARERMTECDCHFYRDSRHYAYFNPSGNYDGEPQEDQRKYTLQDYRRMQSLNDGDWYYIGIRAEAEVGNFKDGYAIIQRITSGGLWEIESDSGRDYLAEVESEQLAELRAELSALGFSKRAISAAFKDVQRKDTRYAEAPSATTVSSHSSTSSLDTAQQTTLQQGQPVTQALPQNEPELQCRHGKELNSCHWCRPWSTKEGD